MRSLRFVALTLVVGSIVGAAQADNGRPVREARSDNERFLLRVRAGHPTHGKSGECKGMLFERRGGSGQRKAIWDAPLVNAIAPMKAFVRNDGRFVVTLDEYRRGGAVHATVVYDNQGKQLREFTLREMLVATDWPHVQAERNEVVWLEGASFAFDDRVSQFVINLRWGREIRIDLDKLVIVGQEGNKSGKDASDDSAIPPEVRALLAAAEALAESETPATQPAGDASVTSQPASGEDAAVASALAELEKLRALSGETAEASASESAPAEQPADQSSDDSAIGLMDLLAADPYARGDNSADLDEATMQEMFQAEELARSGAGNSSEMGVPVPVGDPANPVDYVAWINTFTATDGPSAAPYYLAAADATVKGAMDPELRDAAVEGDPEALADPQVQQWILDNQEALAYTRQAAGYEFNGYDLHSEDGSLIGVLLPSLGNLRELARVSVAQGKQLELEGRPEEAINSYLDTLATGGRARQGVTLIEDLVGVSMERMASDAVLDAYAADEDGRLDYAALAQQVESTRGAPRPMDQTVQFERAMVHDIVQRIYEPDPATGGYRVSAEGLGEFVSLVGTGEDPVDETEAALALGETDYATLMEDVDYFYDDLTDAMASPYPLARERLGEIEAMLDSAEFAAANPVLHQLTPALSRAYTLDSAGTATRRATELVTHLRAYRQQFGSYPDSLEVFGDADFAFDPFTGTPFAYRRDGTDFVLYSLGNNGVDDGGMHDPSMSTNDIRYWPRPPRNP